MRVTIAGTGKCLPGKDIPGRIVTNDEIVRILLSHQAIKPGTDRPWLPEELTPQRIVDLVGIRERQWVDNGVNTSDLALVAAEKALAEAGIGWRDIGILAVGSSTPEAIFPSTACMVLNKAIKKKIADGEWPEKDARTALRIPAFDILAACTSGLFAVDLVRKHLLFEETEAEYGLAVGAEVGGDGKMLDAGDDSGQRYQPDLGTARAEVDGQHPPVRSVRPVRPVRQVRHRPGWPAGRPIAAAAAGPAAAGTRAQRP